MGSGLCDAVSIPERVVTADDVVHLTWDQSDEWILE